MSNPSKFDSIPDELQQVDSGWYLYNFDSNNPKAPRMMDGSMAKWNDSNDVARDDGYALEQAVETLQAIDKFDTIGYRFTDDDEYMYIDFDGCLDEEFNIESQKEWCPNLEQFAESTYTEYSSSGTGLHVFYKGDIPDWWEDIEVDGEHEGIELFDSRMCIFTGNVVNEDVEIMNTNNYSKFEFDKLLLEIYKSIEGELPEALQKDDEHSSDSTDVDRITGDVTEALDNIDPHDIDDILWSEYQGDKGDDWEVYDPGYRNSQSGEALIRNKENNTWFDFQYGHKKAEHIFGILRLFACERGRIDKPTDDLEGKEWVKCYKNFKNKCEDEGIELPELDDESIEVKEDADWSHIRASYKKASNSTERGNVHMMVVNKLISDYNFLNKIDTDELLYYNDGVYTYNGEQRLREILTKGLAGQYRSHKLSQIDDMLRGRSLVEEEELGANEPYVTTENGVLDIVTRELHDYDPDLNAIQKLPVEYDESAKCPTFKEYLEDVIPDEEERKKVQEFFGYTLNHWDTSFGKALFTVGPTNSGKSTLLDVLSMLHNDDATAHVTPQELSEERFAGYDLYQSWINIRNDIPSETVQDVGFFKELITGDDLRVEQKGKPSINIEPKAKHIYAGNQLPNASVDDKAFYERILLVSMPKTIPRSEQDRRLLDKIEDEMPGVLNWAIDGYDRLMKQGEFTADRDPDETEEMWQKWSSSAKRFLHECIEVTADRDGDTLDKGITMEVFEEYANRRGMPSASQQTMTKTITSKNEVSHSNYGGTTGSGEYEGVKLTELGNELLNVVVGSRNSDEDRIKELLQ